MDSTPNVSLPHIELLPSTLPTGDIFQILLYIALIVYVVFTGILFYHWNAYSSDRKVSTATYAMYLIITVPMMLTLITSSVIIK